MKAAEVELRLRTYILPVAVVVMLAAASTSVAAVAEAASTCPTVNQTNGAVSPAPVPGVDWSECNLDYANLSSADLENANLDEAGLYGADLSGANLSGATLAGADMHLVDMSFTDMSSSDMTNVDLTQAFIGETSLDNADLAGAKLDYVYSRDVTGTPSALPAGWLQVDGYLVGPTANLENANLTGADLSGMDLANATLAGGFLDTTDLAGANLQGADLYQTTLSGANLSGTNLAGTDLSGVQSGGLQGNPIGLPAHWILRDGFLLGPGASLYSAQLSGLDLTGADLAGAYFFLAHLVAADLAGVDLKGADMQQADLSGADLFGANVSHVNWDGTRCPGGGVGNCSLAFRLTDVLAPRPDHFLPASQRSLTAVFRLNDDHHGGSLTSRIATAVATAHEVRVILSGKGIDSVAGYCAWRATDGVFRCHVAIPPRISTGKSHRYFLTVQENPNGHFSAARVSGPGIANPTTIYFR
jgi:uncharacterized protein YjbI with pentapeptide repeats